MLLQRELSHLLVVDVQERLLPEIPAADHIMAGCDLLIRAARQLGVGVTLSEHYPKGLGRTPPSLRDRFAAEEIFEKVHFACPADPGLAARFEDLARAGRRQIVICGLETHICILQTALSLQAQGFAPFVVADATATRTADRDARGRERMAQSGVRLVDVDMVIFEWLGRACTDEFRALVPLIKENAARRVD